MILDLRYRCQSSAFLSYHGGMETKGYSAAAVGFQDLCALCLGGIGGFMHPLSLYIRAGRHPTSSPKGEKDLATG